jgi:hypothetical protein
MLATFIHGGTLVPGAGAGAADSRDRQQPFPVRLPASKKVCTRHGIGLTDSYHPQLAVAEGPPHSRQVLIGADVGDERLPVLAQMLAGGPEHLPQRRLPLGGRARGLVVGCFHQALLAPPGEAEVAPPRQFQLLLAPPRWNGDVLQLPWPSPSCRCQRPIRVGPEHLRKGSWWGRENLERWGRNKLVKSVVGLAVDLALQPQQHRGIPGGYLGLAVQDALVAAPEHQAGQVVDAGHLQLPGRAGRRNDTYPRRGLAAVPA